MNQNNNMNIQQIVEDIYHLFDDFNNEVKFINSLSDNLRFSMTFTSIQVV